MNIWLYLAIFAAKMIEVSVSTIRVVFISRGEKVRGAIIGFFEVLIWVILISNVLSNITEDPMKIVVYCLAFAVGNFIGVTIEGKLAIGTASLQTVVDGGCKDELSAVLRENGFGVTITQGEGMEGPVYVLLIFLKRKSVPEAVNLIHQFRPNAMITINDVRQLQNGFIRK